MLFDFPAISGGFQQFPAFSRELGQPRELHDILIFSEKLLFCFASFRRFPRVPEIF